MPSTPDVLFIFELTPDITLKAIKGQPHQLLGYTAEQLLQGHPELDELIHPGDQDLAAKLFLPDTVPDSASINLRLRHADGRIRCVAGHFTHSVQPGGATQLALQLREAKRMAPSLEYNSLMANFQAMMESTGDFIYFKNRHHVFVGASPALVSMGQQTSLIDQTNYDLFPESYADKYYALDQQVLAGAAVTHAVQSMPRQDGKLGWFDNRKYPLRDGDGHLIGLFGIVRDISDLKKAELALAQNEKRLATIFNQVPSIAVQGYDRQRRVIYWNQASEALYGYTHTQALGRQLEDLIIPPSMRASMIQLVDAWCQGGAAIEAAELTMQRADGSAVEVFSSHVMQIDSDGEPEMYCLDIDISGRKAAERALRASELFLRTVVDEIPDPVMLKDHEGNFLLGNRTVATLYGTTPQQMVGKHDGDFGVPQEMAEFFRHNVLSIMAKGETQVVFENSRDNNTGVIRHYRSIKKPLLGVDGQNQILVIAQDITDIIHAQQKVTESEQRLQQVMEIVREGIWDWHLPTGRVIHNPQWYKNLQFDASEIPETVDFFISLIHPQDRQIVQQRLDQMVVHGAMDYHSEHRLLRKDGAVIWVQDRGRVVERDSQGQVLRIVGSFSDISSQRAHKNHLEYMANYDTLTGLPNRVLLSDRMQHAIAQSKRRGLQLAVVYLDLDGFKAVNDHHGHALGDRLLTALSGQFKASMREGDTIARLGRDEFVAILVDLPGIQSAVPMIQRLLDIAASPIELDGHSLRVSASVGVTIYPQIEEADGDQLLRQADQAMYSAKMAGKNRYHLFDTAHDRTLRLRNASVLRIQQALRNGELVLYYQPKVNLRTGDVVGAEALIRWWHPQRGLLAPGLFLPEIQNHAIGIELGEWVMDTALRQIEWWRSAGIELPVSINLTGHHLQQPQFTESLKAALARHPQVKPGQLELEVLETSALEDISLVAHVITECATWGVSFALDDFGTGFSTLTHLKRLPAQTLKIDQSFIRDMLVDPEDLAIVKGVLGLATAFKRQVIAEGVETPAHCRMLLDIGCDLAQGYGIAHPMPAQEIPAWIAQWHLKADWLG
ncbi:EAL domain-containing protein [Simplicispira psychrophila]|uniref:EAL domain-containing protein n=1 Tax=Simplicispira psychrophila TaxID=80882 RepID=UPI0006923C87|nr:EAL domain-containing protein [Simplicispira psychrophila]